nr:MAG TPA: hypothetical protein [Bacteriophage sp.]
MVSGIFLFTRNFNKSRQVSKNHVRFHSQLHSIFTLRLRL